MIFFNEFFVFSMLIASLLYWFAVPSKFRATFITSTSICALAWLQPIFTVILIGLIFAVYLAGLQIAKEDNQKVKKLMTTLISLTIFLLLGKYAHAIFTKIFSQEVFFFKMIIVPLGISYLSFKLIAFVIDVYRGIITNFKFMELLCFIVFLPTFPAGPIERFQNFESKHETTFNSSSYISGLKRIIIGYFKKVVLINLFLTEYLIKYLQPELLSNIGWDLPASKIIIFLLGALLYSYLDLSSYADIAIGYSKLFGYNIIEDMNLPIFRSNLSQYWNCWHISLSSWCRNYIYFPVLGSTRRNNFALYSSFIIMGLWHNLTINWILWGLWHASGLILFSKWSKIKKKFFKKHKKFKNIMPRPVGYTLGVSLTCLYSSLGFAFIFVEGMGSQLQNSLGALQLILSIFI